MLVENCDLKKLKFIGFFDSCFFKQNEESGGYVFQDKNGKNIFLTYREVKQIIKREKQK